MGEGSYKEAEHLMLLSISHLLREQQQEQQEQQDADCMMMMEQDGLQVTVSPPAFGAVPLEDVFESDDWSPNEDVPTASFYLFRHLLFVENSKDGAPIFVNTSIHLVTLCFNLAMFYHETGLLDGDLMRLAAARTYYHLARSHLGVGQAPTMASLPALAIFNNLGHLSSFFGDQETMLFCQETLEQLMNLQEQQHDHQKHQEASRGTVPVDPELMEELRDSLAHAYKGMAESLSTALAA